MTSVGGRTFDLTNQRHYILLASGLQVEADTIGGHDLEASSEFAVLLTNPANIEPATISTLLLAHGSLMMVSWIGLTSIAILFSRYFKKTWANQRICGKDVWFIIHAVCNTLTLILTISGFIIIFVDIGEWRTSPHSIAGTVVMAFVLLQVIGASFRPEPTAKGRPIFNLLHFYLGNITHGLAIITIFIAVPIRGAELPIWTVYVLLAFVVCYLLMHITLSVSILWKCR